MKLEYLDDIDGGGKFTHVVSEQLIRLYDFDTLQAKEFRNAIEKYLIIERKSLDLKSLAFVTPLNCNLILRIADCDRGITSDDKQNFFCDLTLNSYYDMIQLIQPFCDEDLSGYQWLYDVDTVIDFLFSPGGTL